MGLVKAKINHELLEWARKSAGFSVDAASRKLSINVDRLLAMEEGEIEPTFGQLQKFSKVYKQPFSTFYLSKVPKLFELPTHDFRRLPGEVALNYSPEVTLEMKSVIERRKVALSLLADLDVMPSKFTLRASINDETTKVARKIRRKLDIEFDEQKTWRGKYKSFNGWRRKIEDTGVLVFQAANIPTSEMRGFSIYQNTLPIIVVNQKDRPKGRAFSLLHEFVHLMLRKSGLCDIDENSLRPPEEEKVEIFCNQVAAETLVPSEILLSQAIVSQNTKKADWDNQEIKDLASNFGVSEEVILRRLLTLGKTTNAFYNDKRKEFLAYYKKLENQPFEGEFRRNKPQEAVSNFGKPFVNLVINNYHQDKIPLSDVSKYLDIRAKHLPRIEKMLGA